jgi:hypothetical protein
MRENCTEEECEAGGEKTGEREIRERKYGQD